MAVSETGGFSPGGIFAGALRGIIGGRDVKIRPVPAERLEYDAARANAIARATEAAIQRGELPRPPGVSLPELARVGFDLAGYNRAVRELIEREVNPQFPDVSRTFDDVPPSFADLPAAERAQLARPGGGVWEPPPLLGRVSFDPFATAAAVAGKPAPRRQPRRPPRRRTKPPERPQPRPRRPDRRLPPRIRPPPLPPRPDIPGPVRELPGLFRWAGRFLGPLSAFWALVTNPPPRRFSDGPPRPPEPPQSPPARAPRPRLPPAQPDREAAPIQRPRWEPPREFEFTDLEAPPGPDASPPPAPAPVTAPAPVAVPGPAPQPAPPVPAAPAPVPGVAGRPFPWARLGVPAFAAAALAVGTRGQGARQALSSSAVRPAPPAPSAFTGVERGQLQSEGPLQQQCRELARQRRQQQKRKRKRKRTECWKGSYIETDKGTRKRRRVRVNCTTGKELT